MNLPDLASPCFCFFRGEKRSKQTKKATTAQGGAFCARSLGRDFVSGHPKDAELELKELLRREAERARGLPEQRWKADGSCAQTQIWLRSLLGKLGLTSLSLFPLVYHFDDCDGETMGPVPVKSFLREGATSMCPFLFFGGGVRANIAHMLGTVWQIGRIPGITSLTRTWCCMLAPILHETNSYFACYWVGSLDFNFSGIKGFSTKPPKS